MPRNPIIRHKIAIVGSRKFSNLQWVRKFVQLLPINSIVISGGASGVDFTAEAEARQRNMYRIVFHAGWWTDDKKGAGFQRNSWLVDYADSVIAFWDGSSRGTNDSITKAKDYSKKLIIIRDKQDFDKACEWALNLPG